MRALKRFFFVFLLALICRACVFEPVRQTDDSMQPTLAEDTIAFVSKLTYGIRVPGAGTMLWEWSKPKKKDVVVVVGVGEPPMELVRRIEARPGDSYTRSDGSVGTLGSDEYFVLAEHGEGMADSKKFGPVKRKTIVGKVTYFWASKNASADGETKVESKGPFWSILRPIL